MTFERKLVIRNCCNMLSFIVSLSLIVAGIVCVITIRNIPNWLFAVPFFNFIFLYTVRRLTDPFRS